MFSGSIGEEQDNAMQRRILLRKQRDEERRIRLLNARERVMGVDVNALQQQINEKKAAKAAEKAADALYASTNVAIKNVLEEENLRVQEEQFLRKMELQSAWDIQMANGTNCIVSRIVPVSMGNRTIVGAIVIFCRNRKSSKWPFRRSSYLLDGCPDGSRKTTV